MGEEHLARIEPPRTGRPRGRYSLSRYVFPRNTKKHAYVVLDTLVLNRAKDAGTDAASFFSGLVSKDPWYKDTVPEFRVLPQSELPKECDHGVKFKSVCINTAIYLPYLVGQCLKNGVKVQRAVLKHINEAASMHHSGKEADIVINCSGLLACKLGGVMDKDVIAVRGQIVVVRNDPKYMFTVSQLHQPHNKAANRLPDLRYR